MLVGPGMRGGDPGEWVSGPSSLGPYAQRVLPVSALVNDVHAYHSHAHRRAAPLLQPRRRRSTTAHRRALWVHNAPPTSTTYTTTMCTTTAPPPPPAPPPVSHPASQRQQQPWWREGGQPSGGLGGGGCMGVAADQGLDGECSCRRATAVMARSSAELDAY